MKFILGLLRESFLFSWQALTVNRLRTALSLAGVSIGIFSIIFVLSVVDSLEADMKESLETIGSDVVFIQKWPMAPEDGAEQYEWWNYMQRRQPRLSDMNRLQERLTDAQFIAFEVGTQKTVEYRNNFIPDVYMSGISHRYPDIRALNLQEGRFFTSLESESGRAVAIIGHEIAAILFDGGEAIGREVKIGGLRVTVIGVLRKEGNSLFGNSNDQTAFVPVRFATRLVNPEYSDAKIILKAKPGISSAELRDELIATFREIRGIKPKAKNDFSVIESSMLSGFVDSLVGIFNVVGIIIGIFAILVGAFSIANIMFVSVKERTNLIGIQKAIGAKNYFILLQFLFESIALCLMGGAMGLMAVWAVVLVLNSLVEFTFILPFTRILSGIGIAAVVGVISGIAPALSASRLSPVDAMRAK